MRRRPPAFEVLRKTPSRRASPSMQASAVIQLADRLMTRDRSARRTRWSSRWRRVHVMQIVAMMMSDIGSSDRSPLSGMRRRSSDPDSSSPVTTSSRRANASISRSRNHPSDAIR